MDVGLRDEPLCVELEVEGSKGSKIAYRPATRGAGPLTLRTNEMEAFLGVSRIEGLKFRARIPSKEWNKYQRK
jgi:hypothetical protein